MKFRVFLLFVFFTSVNWSSHPVHMSVVNMTLDENGRHLSYSVRLFQDDLMGLFGMLASEAMHNNKTLDTNAISIYIEEKFRLKTTDSLIPVTLVKEKIDQVEYWLYFECELPQQTDSLYIENSILTDVIEEQQNLVIFSYKNKEKGLTFGSKVQKQLLLLETN